MRKLLIVLLLLTFSVSNAQLIALMPNQEGSYDGIGVDPPADEVFPQWNAIATYTELDNSEDFTLIRTPIITYDGVDKTDGNWSMVLTGDGVNVYSYAKMTIPVTAGKEYTVTWSMKVDVLSGQSFDVEFLGTETRTYPTTAWVEYTHVGVAESNSFEFRINATNTPTNTNSIKVDQMTVVEADPPTPPASSMAGLYNFRVNDTNKDRVYFDADSSISGLTSAGFIVTDNTVSSLVIDGDNLGGYVVVGTAFNYWDNNTIRMESGNGTVEDFTLEHIVNNITITEGSLEEYYVKNGGSDANNGLTEGTAFATLNKALSMMTNATGGYKIWVKAGSYSGAQSESNYLSASHIANPVVIEGYKSVIGDITSNYFEYTENGTQTLLPAEMPLFTGAGKASGQYWLNLGYNSYYIIRNIQLKEYTKGIQVQASLGMRFERINMLNLGDEPVSPGKGTGVGFSMIGTTTDGKLNNNASHQTMKDCNVMNASLDSYLVYGPHFLIEDCFASNQINDLANQGGAATDYYFAIKSRFGIIKRSTCWKDTPNGIGHGGHGFDLKTAEHEADFNNDNLKVQYNLIDSCEAINVGQGYTFRHKNVQYNVVKRSISRADVVNRRVANDDWIYSGGLAYIDGGSYNILEECYFHDLDNAISFLQSTGEHDPEPSYGATQHNSTVRNTIIDDVRYVFAGRNVHASATSSQYDNKFYNNTVTNALWMYWIKPNNPFNWQTNNLMYNNIIENIPTKDLPTSLNTNGWQYNYDVTDNIWVADGTPLTGTGNISIDPILTTVTYVPTATFTSIDVPQITGLYFDYNGMIRASTTTAGAVKHVSE